MNGKWGIINKEGAIILPATFDAISSFKHKGYAVVQKDGKAGLVNQIGAFVFPLQYNDIRVISKDLFSVDDGNEWTIIDIRGNKILNQYEEIELINNNFILFWRNGKCGIVHTNSKEIIPAQYEKIRFNESQQLFYTQNNNKKGAYHHDGKQISAAILIDLKYVSRDFILIKSKYKWSAIDGNGNSLFPDIYSKYELMDFGFVQLSKQEKNYLYDSKKKRFIHSKHYVQLIPLDENWIVFQQYEKVGLINTNNDVVIKDNAEEILLFNDSLFRVKSADKWGLVHIRKKNIAPAIYDYISPLDNGYALAKKDNLYGIIDQDGKLIINTIYEKIEFTDQQIIAHQGTQYVVYQMNHNSLEKKDDFKKYTRISIKKRKRKPPSHIRDLSLNEYEWFYNPVWKKWGLRSLANGSIKIPPLYDFIDIKREYGFTVAGNRISHTQQFGAFPVRFNKHFHIVENATGLIHTEKQFREVRFSDFEKGKPSARFILEDGKHGLLDRKGKIVCRGYAYIGTYEDGLAPMAISGHLSTDHNKNEQIIGYLDEYLEGSYGNYVLGEYNKRPTYIPQVACSDCAWGYIDTLGKMMVPPDYEAALPFKHQSGIVRKNGKWGLVNRQAREIIPCKHDRLSYFDNESKILHIQNNCQKFSLIDSMGNFISQSRADEIGNMAGNMIAYKKAGKWGYMLPNGKNAIRPQFVKARSFSEKMAAVFNGKKWGFINLRGELIIDYLYPRVGDFKDGLVWVNTSKGTGYINKDKEWVIAAKFKKANDFEHGIARVKTKQGIRLINKEGKYVSDHTFDELSSFDSYGLAVASNLFRPNVSYYLVNRKGERVGHHTFKKIYPFCEGMAAVKKKQYFGFINTSGEIIIPASYDKVSQFSEGLAWVKTKGNCGYIDKLGKFVVEPTFSKCQDFEDGKAIVYANARKGGLMDKKGDFVIQPRLNKLLAFSEGKGLVKKNKKFHFVRENGEIYEGYFDQAESFENGLALVLIDNRWGVINEKGAVIISPKYGSIERMGNSIMKVKISKLQGILTPSGQYLLYPEYEFIQYMGNGVIKVEQGSKIGYINLQGKWIWPLNRNRS